MATEKSFKPAPLAAIERARVRVADLKAERQRVEDAPTTLAEARATIALRVERHAAAWRESAEIAFFAAPPSIYNRTTASFEAETLCPPLSVTDPEALTAVLMREVEAYTEGRGGEGLPSHERPAELARIDEAIAAAELHEEECICQAERAGFAPLRRADASPAAVLAFA